MASKIIFITIFSFNFLILSAQINISFDEDCMEKNTLLFSELLIDAMGEDFVSNFLEENNALLVFLDVDSLGHIVKVKKIRPRKELDNSSREKIISALKSSNIRFTVCYRRTTGSSDSEAYKRISKEWFNEEKPTHPINVAFPGTIMDLYILRRFDNDNEPELSKLQFIMNLISKYHLEYVTCPQQ